MSLPKEVLLFAIQSTNNSEVAATRIMTYEKIRQRAIDRNTAITQIQEEANQKIKKLMAEKICSHDVRKTHGDPSGNGDSYEECLICGENIYERAVRFT